MKTIKVSDKYGNKYTLEFTRDTVIILEKAGFDINNPDEKMMTSVELLFEGAFIANHKNIKPETVREIFARQKNKQGLLSKLVEMYKEPFDTLMEEPDEGEDWESNW